jgi:hypothetical protein
MSFAEKTQISFFRKILPDIHYLPGKKPKSRFLVKFDPTAMIYAKKTEITVFHKS